MIHYGMISEVQGTKARVDIGGVTTDFLPVFQLASDFKQSWTPVKVKEQCVILAPFNDLNSGCVLRGLYYSAYEPPSTEETKEVMKYSDGTTISYDVANGVLAIDAVKDITIRGTNINVSCASATVTADSVVVDSPSVDLGGTGGMGVVTQGCTCAFTGAMHPVGSQTVRAKI